MTVLTAAGAGSYTVSGTVSPVGWEDAVFFTDGEAARLAPRIAALVALGAVGRVREAVGADAEVLTGQDRHRADASRDRDREALDNTVTLVPVMASVAGTTAVFVVASTFAFAVIQRRREVALLRTVGATPRQVRRMIRNEALLVSGFASAAGAVLGLFGAQLLADMLIGSGVSPPWFRVEPSLHWTVLAPLVAAFLVGVLVALCGVAVAARRAGTIRPVEALREAAVDDSGMIPGRLLLGAAALLCGAGLTAWIALGDPAVILSPSAYALALLVPVLAAAVLAPLAVGPLTRLLMWPLRRLSGPTAMLVRESALTSRRRTAATAAPILLTVGLTFSLLSATEALGAARADGLQNQVSSQYALAPAGTPGISRQAVERVARIEGVRVVAPVPVTLYTPDEGRLEVNDGLAVEAGVLRRMMSLEVVDGSLDDLDSSEGSGTVVPDLWHLGVGSTFAFLTADGSAAELRVAATYRAVRGADVAYLPQRFAAGNRLAPRAYVSLEPGTDRAAAVTAIRKAVAGTGARLVTRDQLVASEGAYARHLTEVRQRSITVIVVVFCFIAILNTLLMATADRRRDLAVLRMTGATPKQVMRFFVAESLLVAAIGVALALAATSVNLVGLWGALHQLFGTAPITAPYAVIAGIAAVCTLLAVAGTVLPVGAALRAGVVRVAGLRE
ncbi:FtsX-like permease family protein [Streptomyces sp. NPDC051940]|uniref:FtsX-like permease family protein n=1 Tax=Streptomyces sp. NPDC051940 TaxID=3155675 RepID=UPI003435301F